LHGSQRRTAPRFWGKAAAIRPKGCRIRARGFRHRHSGARLFGANPESSQVINLWIPGPREDACPGMTDENARGLL
jgi:hypothetical protein